MITREMIISDILKLDKHTSEILINNGMHCLNCPSASGESLEEACSIHGINVDKLLLQLNSYLERKK